MPPPPHLVTKFDPIWRLVQRHDVKLLLKEEVWHALRQPKGFLFLFMLKSEVSKIDILYRASWLARWRRVQARGVAWSPTQLTYALWAGAGGSSHRAPTRPTTAQAPAPSLSHRYPGIE